MAMQKHGVILVGHGGVPKGCPQDLITKLKRLEAQRRAANLPPSAEELELDTKVRQWPRTAETDPYQAGLEAVAAQLRTQLNGALFAVAYNEFCAPTLEESVEALIKQGATHITVTTTMFTPGGSHSEVEIPEILDQLRPQHPHVELRYAWPFDLRSVANTLADQIRRFS
jgi:sirohydrochlorin cobaltochelatase